MCLNLQPRIDLKISSQMNFLKFEPEEPGNRDLFFFLDFRKFRFLLDFKIWDLFGMAGWGIFRESRYTGFLTLRTLKIRIFLNKRFLRKRLLVKKLIVCIQLMENTNRPSNAEKSIYFRLWPEVRGFVKKTMTISKLSRFFNVGFL